MSNRGPGGLGARWPPTPLELRSIIPLGKKKDKDATTAEGITNLSPQTLRRRFPDKVRQLSDRREGMTLGDALEIAGIQLP